MTSGEAHTKRSLSRIEDGFVIRVRPSFIDIRFYQVRLSPRCTVLLNFAQDLHFAESLHRPWSNDDLVPKYVVGPYPKAADTR